MDLIKRQRWEKLFKRRELIHIDAIKEFYARLTMVHFKKKEVARSQVRGVDIEFDNFRLASILSIPGNNGICEYIKEVWEESKYTKPLEITRKFTNDNIIMEARRVRSIEMKPFQRFIHILVMKNVVPRFRKRDTTSYIDLIYMDHIVSRRLVNLPRVMMRHMSYVISVKDHELPLCGENRRRDDEKVAPAEAEAVAEAPAVPAFPASPGDLTNQQKEPEALGVDPSGLSGHIPDYVMSKLQADFERARAKRIQADLEKA
ncbi:hypothetical protein Dimus_022446 [Dionaea muscipula]